MPVALETIDYQYKDSFPNEVEKLVSSIYSDIEKKTYEDTVKLVGKSSDIKSLEKLFMRRLGLNVKFSPYWISLHLRPSFLSSATTFETLTNQMGSSSG